MGERSSLRVLAPILFAAAAAEVLIATVPVSRPTAAGASC